MSEQKENMYTAAEDYVKNALSGEKLKNALDFIAYLKESGRTCDEPNPHPHFAYMGMWSCLIIASKDKKDPLGFYFVCMWPGEHDVLECDSFPVEESVKEFARKNVKKCNKCYGECFNLGGLRRTVFGKEFDGVCCNVFHINSPAGETLENVIKLLELQKHIKSRMTY